MPATLTYPGTKPGPTRSSMNDEIAILENAAIRCEWAIVDGQVTGLNITNKHTGQIESFDSGCLPRLILGNGDIVDLAGLTPEKPFALDGNAITADFNDDEKGLQMQWSAILKNDLNAMVQTLQLTATKNVMISELIAIYGDFEGAEQVGEVTGSVVVWQDMFMAIENPLATNVIADDGRVRCSLAFMSEVAAGRSWTHTCAIGVVPDGQLRRGFSYYIDQRRIYPYRQFLHYNNWYDVMLSRPTERMTEPEALEAIEYYGRELVEKRGVKLDAVVWDDGWDDFNTLWGFHKKFPEGFKNLTKAGREYGFDQGVWMSPNGGYARAKDARIAYGEPLGYETNHKGFAMGGPNYRKAFQDVCIKMIRDNGVVFFKFDGMGDNANGVDTSNGVTGELSDDIQAILELSRDLHAEIPDVYISATAGTWASPFWLLYADSIWRQGGDSGHHGEGNTRQQWITYRDKFCHDRVVQAGPLCPTNSLMLHGVLIGNRPGRAPAGILLDEKSVADEVWSFFASGTCLQELYVTPDLPTESMLDHIATAAKWARANEHILIDTHWVGGSPGDGEAYGRASWQPDKGIVTLRNPSETIQTFGFTLKGVFELPEGSNEPMTVTAIYPETRDVPGGMIEVSQLLEIELQPFETIVIEFNAIK